MERDSKAIYIQKEGISMGNQASPALANYYCHLKEKEVNLHRNNKNNLVPG
jgi:hypothetical protein